MSQCCVRIPMKCVKCGENLPTVGIWTRLEVTCPRCGGQHPPTWFVFLFAALMSFFLLIRLWTFFEQSGHDLLSIVSTISGVVLVALLWTWTAVLWRRRRAVTPRTEKIT